MTTPAAHALAAHAAARAIAARELSSQEVVQACLDRIAERDETVGAWEHLDPEAALAQARARDGEPSRGRLHGVPVGVKDVIDTKDLPTGYGSPIHAGHRPVADAPCVMRLRAAGAVVLGKTVTTEFAMYTPGRTANPHDPRRTPGGSSSGSAAAVADGMVPVALGTQTAGSILRPAAFCGVLGFKPSHGLLPTTGIKPLSARLDTLGVLARDPSDLALVTEVIAGTGLPGAPVSGAPALALARTHWWDRADDAGRNALLEAGERLRDAGARVTEVVLPDAFDGLAEAQDTLMAFDAARALAPEREGHAEHISPQMRDFLERGAGIDPAATDDAVALAAHCNVRLAEEVLEGHDALLVPAVVGEAPVGLDTTGDPLFCRAWTLLGAPAVAVPGLRGPDGMPIGIQLVGRAGADRALLDVAAWVAARLG